MNATSVDPQFVSYLREPPRLSYSQPDDSWLSRQLVESVEVLFGRRRVEAIYHELKSRSLEITQFFEAALTEARISLNYNQQALKQIPSQGPLMFVANHPFGVVDGLALCDLVVKQRGDFRIMLHALLCQDAELAPYFLPIDFKKSPQATRTNIRSKQLAFKALAADIPVIIFPSGMVSTAGRAGFGKVTDAPWTTFAAKIIREAHATVIPVYFHGQNSRKFHVASYLAEPLRMGLLIHEALKKFGHTLQMEIGAPLGWEALQVHDSRQKLTDFLYAQVQAMGEGRHTPVTELTVTPAE